MAELKTKKESTSVDEFLGAIADDKQRADALRLRALMAKVTGDKGSMWGSAIVGFGKRTYRNASGKENDWFETGFSPRKGKTALYVSSGAPLDVAAVKKLGKVEVAKGCFYVKSLANVDEAALLAFVKGAVAKLRQGSGATEAKPAKAVKVAKAVEAKGAAKRPSAKRVRTT